MECVRHRLIALVVVIFVVITAVWGCKTRNKSIQRSFLLPLSRQDSNVVKTSWTSVGCWFWFKEEFEKEGYKPYIDLFEKHSPFALLTASMRCPGDLTEPRVRDQIKAASLYAKSKGIGLVMDLDVRLARDSFYAKYPDELQQIVLLREISLEEDSVSIEVKGKSLHDHYTNRRYPYYPVETKLLKVYSYQKEGGVIKSGTVTDISNLAISISTKDRAYVTVKPGKGKTGNTACVMVAITLFTPDVFAPHLLSYQRHILNQYADAALAGAAKDEWGFPGRFIAPDNDLWYSPAMAKLYEQQRPGRNLLRDMLLMTYGEEGADTQRTATVNHYMQMYWTRNAEIEIDFYNAIKEVLGKEAMYATHPSWFPYPDSREIFKNGLDWWVVKKDVAQVDETTPFSARTALSKKWHSPIWLNMYYDKDVKLYYKEIWRAALGGGRINYHPPPTRPIPVEPIRTPFTPLLRDSLMIAESRINLLNYISETPAYCPVAVVFGHPAALNWSDKKQFADIGLGIVNQLWKQGYYTDLIPSSEIVNGSLTVNANGKIQYGPQEYEAVIYYHPEYDKRSVAEFFRKAGKNNKTILMRVGNWTTDFDGNAFDGNTVMGAFVMKSDSSAAATTLIPLLRAKNVTIQTAGEELSSSEFPSSVMPKASGQLTLIDGTHILVSGEQQILGDTIIRKFEVSGYPVDVDAVGVAAVKVSPSGELEALACGGMKMLKVGKFTINLPERMDIALIRHSGKWGGIIHNSKSTKIPAALLRITSNWTLVRQPEILQDISISKK